MKLLSIEESLIRLLTKIVWWFDIAWNKGTVFVFFFFCFYFPAGFHFLISVLTIEAPTEASIFRFLFRIVGMPLLLGCYITLIPLCALVIYWSTSRVNALKETKIAPNPNRHNGWLWVVRLLAFSCLFATFLINIEHIDETFLLLFLVFFDVPIIAALYVLCVDPIPPQEKKKRTAEKEPKKLSLALN